MCETGSAGRNANIDRDGEEREERRKAKIGVDRCC